MKRLFLTVLIFGLLSLIALRSAEPSYRAQDWSLRSIPASYNQDRTIYLFGDRPQILTFMLKSVAGNLNRGYQVHLEFELPAKTQVYGFEALNSKAIQLTTEPEADGVRATVEFDLQPIVLQDIAVKDSEWQNLQLAVKLPSEISQKNLTVTLTVNGKLIDRYQWPLKLEQFIQGTQPKLLRLGLWDYGINRCTFAGAEMVDFLSDCGFNYNQVLINPERKASSGSMISGGGIHQSFFNNPKYPDFKPDSGEEISWGYAGSQAILDHGTKIVEGGIAEMARVAAEQSGIAMLDFEPSGYFGFSKESTARFRREYGVSEADFQKFMSEYAKKDFSMFLTQDPLCREIMKKWTVFRSKQDQEMIGAIASAAKAVNPTMKVELSTHPSIGENHISSFALGHENGAMAKYIDGIMPQIYIGYTAAAAKATALENRRWKQELTKINPDCKLYPVLLVRFSGVEVFNSPESVRMQMIAAVAEGANGVVLYYPQNMDARYYQQFAKGSGELARFEKIYQSGMRNDKWVVFSNMPIGKSEVERWPGYYMSIENPFWHYTVHQKDGETLLTLFNFNQEKKTNFRFKVPAGEELLEVQNAQILPKTADGANVFEVAPNDVAYLLFRNKNIGK